MSKKKIIKPTQASITAEIEALKEIKPDVRRYSFFGDDHHRAIDAQIAVLKENLTDDQIYDRFGEEADPDSFKENVLSAACDARRWLDAESDDGPPSKGWRSPALKARKE